MAAEESVLIAEAFHIVCIFRKKDLMMIDARVIAGERQIASKQNKSLALLFSCTPDTAMFLNVL